jgi:hypothetical protein
VRQNTFPIHCYLGVIWVITLNLPFGPCGLPYCQRRRFAKSRGRVAAG